MMEAELLSRRDQQHMHPYRLQRASCCKPSSLHEYRLAARPYSESADEFASCSCHASDDVFVEHGPISMSDEPHEPLVGG
jgi:hypothetical protein